MMNGNKSQNLSLRVASLIGVASASALLCFPAFGSMVVNNATPNQTLYSQATTGSPTDNTGTSGGNTNTGGTTDNTGTTGGTTNTGGTTDNTGTTGGTTNTGGTTGTQQNQNYGTSGTRRTRNRQNNRRYNTTGGQTGGVRGLW